MAELDRKTYLAYNETPTKGKVMFTKKNVEKSGLEEARDAAVKVLVDMDPSDPEYCKTLKAVKTLSNLMQAEQREKLSVNTAATVIGTLASVAMIVGHERAHIVTSKALAFLPKLLK